MTDVTVGICTFRRSSLFATLKSVAEQSLPPNVRVKIVVADNDESAKLAESLAQFASENDLDLTYVHAPARNISIARNACLSAARDTILLFIDDDELAEPDWIRQHLAAFQAKAVPVIFGPAHAVYPSDAPDWMRSNSFHSNIPNRNGDVVETGFSSNVLLDMTDDRVGEERFSPTFGRTGGEDVDFFFRLHRKGVVMDICHDAAVTEPVERRRMSFQWLLRRRHTTGKIYGHCLLAGTGTSRPVFMAKCLAKVGFCGGRALISILNKRRLTFWIMRGGFHAGALAGAFSPPKTEFYGKAT
ncbi:glycosyltransferase family 2 protein [Actibacterium sp. 188UL27-1]|uniref:glycosyltransferase family 2 protein n=1 Tax=Actibacterium sp. 188UL27-1 TaxID=2786961 RepID=UPI001957A366|nr:glycosyltransferase family 2 protein [Actibacterium sp. 188UL27-1]